MAVTADLLRTLSVAKPADAWRAIRDYAYATCTAPLLPPRDRDGAGGVHAARR